MKKLFFLLLIPVINISLPVLVSGQSVSEVFYQSYQKQEYDIPMRDGIKLHTTVFSPKDTSKSYPILIWRTCYSCRPYGEDQYQHRYWNKYMIQDKYIFICQDVRGRWMSEGQFDNMRPYIPNKKTKNDIDESSDTFDTIEWLINNIKNHNGKVGISGISYPGFYATYAAIDAHPALLAVSPQAPIGDFYFDDFHHNGAYTLAYWRITPLFGIQHDGPTQQQWYEIPQPDTKDQYQFYMDAGPLHNLDAYFSDKNFFWKQLKNHPNYDDFWQKRNIIQHLTDVKPAMMTVGGWFDAEDLYGPLNTYKKIESNNPETYNTIVMGPWSHGDWGRKNGRQTVGNIDFGENISDFYQYNIERNFFRRFLKDNNMDIILPEAYMFDTGLKKWTEFKEWPPENISFIPYFIHDQQQFSSKEPEKNNASFDEFISDPAKPVPYSEDIKVVGTPRKYMTDDQRFAARRPDVLVYETPYLQESKTLAGPVEVELWVSTTGTDADWVVKLVDVFPPDHEDIPDMQDHLKASNYHMMVRSEIMRGKFRESFSNPVPFRPNEITKINFRLQDVYHTFKEGHKIQVQVQSTWFPLFDRNPQTFVKNIFYAEEKDFKKQTHRVYHSADYPSKLYLPVLN